MSTLGYKPADFKDSREFWTFSCAFCGEEWHFLALAGWDGPRRYCEDCIIFLDGLALPDDLDQEGRQ